MAEGLKRGDLVLVALPGDYGKPRPAVILQDLPNAPAESIVVCPLTSTLIASGPLRPTMEPDPQNGLQLTSQVMVDKITAAAAHKVGPRIGSLAPAQMEAIERAIAKLLGMERRS